MHKITNVTFLKEKLLKSTHILVSHFDNFVLSLRLLTAFGAVWCAPKNCRGSLVHPSWCSLVHVHQIIGESWCTVRRFLEVIWWTPVGAVCCSHNYLVRVQIWCTSHRLGPIWCAPNCTNMHQLTASVNPSSYPSANTAGGVSSSAVAVRLPVHNALI